MSSSRYSTKTVIVPLILVLGTSSASMSQAQSTESNVINPVTDNQIAVDAQANTVEPLADELLLSVYKSPACGCCIGWIEHMERAGFKVEAHDVDNLNDYKVKAKLGAGQGSCHTAFIDGYAIEGHVPAQDVLRLLEQRPDITGLTAPGMPQVSPGMVPEGVEPSGYEVYSYTDGEIQAVFSAY